MKKQILKRYRKYICYAFKFGLLFLFSRSNISFSQRRSVDECENLRFSRFSGVYNGTPATLDVLYSKSDSIVRSLFFSSSTISNTPLGLEPDFEFVKNGVVIDDKAFEADPDGGVEIVDWVKFYGSAKLNPKSYSVNWKRYYDKKITYRLQIVASFKDNYELFTGKDTSSPTSKKAVLLKRDSVNDYKYLNEIKHFCQLVHTKYPDSRVSLKAINFFDNNLISGLFLFGVEKGDNSKVKAFTFLREKGSLFDIYKSLTAKEIDSLPSYDGSGVSFFLTQTGIVAFWMGYNNHSSTYYYYGNQLFTPYENLSRRLYNKLMDQIR